MAKSLLYAVNNLEQTVAAGGNISFGSPVRRFGCNCNISNGTPYIVGAGYYLIDSNFTFEAGAAGTAVLTLYKDGEAIPGANATLTVAADSVYSVSIPAVIRQFCATDASITAVLSGVAGTVTNAAVIVTKL